MEADAGTWGTMELNGVLNTCMLTCGLSAAMYHWAFWYCMMHHGALWCIGHWKVDWNNIGHSALWRLMLVHQALWSLIVHLPLTRWLVHWWQHCTIVDLRHKCTIEPLGITWYTMELYGALDIVHCIIRPTYTCVKVHVRTSCNSMVLRSHLCFFRVVLQDMWSRSVPKSV
jgi:hypothetical protein